MTKVIIALLTLLFFVSFLLLLSIVILTLSLVIFGRKKKGKEIRHPKPEAN